MTRTSAELECFYTGTAHIGVPSHGARPLSVPSKDDPTQGVVPSIEKERPSRTSSSTSRTTTPAGACPRLIGPMDFPNLVFNVHIYCGARSPVTGNPTDVDACADQEEHSLAVRQSDRQTMASPAQPAGPGLDGHRVRRHQ